jgi:hypothetical protein
MIAFLPAFDPPGSLVSAFSQAPAWMKAGFFFMCWVGVWIPIAIPIARAVEWKFPQPLEIRQKLPLVASLYLLAPIVLYGFSWIERRPFSIYGLDWNWNLGRSLLWGLGIGVVGIIVLFGIQTIAGWIHWQSENWGKLRSAIAPTLLLGLWIGGVEELVFRGVLFGQLSKEFDFWSAAIASSLIFAVLHLIWEGTENIPQLPGLSLMGVVLCLAFSVNHSSIGLAWGLHAGWIWLMASLDTATLVSYPSSAPDWLVGLGEKPLAGLLGLLFLLGTGLLLIPMSPLLN